MATASFTLDGHAMYFGEWMEVKHLVMGGVKEVIYKNGNYFHLLPIASHWGPTQCVVLTDISKSIS